MLNFKNKKDLRKSLMDLTTVAKVAEKVAIPDGDLEKFFKAHKSKLPSSPYSHGGLYYFRRNKGSILLRKDLWGLASKNSVAFKDVFSSIKEGDLQVSSDPYMRSSLITKNNNLIINLSNLSDSEITEITEAAAESFDGKIVADIVVALAPPETPDDDLYYMNPNTVVWNAETETEVEAYVFNRGMVESNTINFSGDRITRTAMRYNAVVLADGSTIVRGEHMTNNDEWRLYIGASRNRVRNRLLRREQESQQEGRGVGSIPRPSTFIPTSSYSTRRSSRAGTSTSVNRTNVARTSQTEPLVGENRLTGSDTEIPPLTESHIRSVFDDVLNEVANHPSNPDIRVENSANPFPNDPNTNEESL